MQILLDRFNFHLFFLLWLKIRYSFIEKLTTYQNKLTRLLDNHKYWNRQSCILLFTTWFGFLVRYRKRRNCISRKFYAHHKISRIFKTPIPNPKHCKLDMDKSRFKRCPFQQRYYSMHWRPLSLYTCNIVPFNDISLVRCHSQPCSTNKLPETKVP